MHTIEQMYLILKSTYHKIWKGNSFKDVKALSIDKIRESLVFWLIYNNKAHKKSSHNWSVDDVEVIE